MPSRRRTNAVAGWVKFPVDSASYVSSKEGGLLVKLVVADNRDYDASDWNICCGAAVFDTLQEVFVGDDQCAKPADVELSGLGPDESMAAMNAEMQARLDWQRRHFPNLEDSTRGDSEFTSRHYLAVMVLGVTGWSGVHVETGELWNCKVDDLTEDGKALYRQVERLYPGCILHLLTFLDT